MDYLTTSCFILSLIWLFGVGGPLPQLGVIYVNVFMCVAFLVLIMG